MEQIFYPADILLPDDGTDMTKWSVIACDQFTSEADYWKEVEEIAGDAPSTLRLILPEVYLETDEEPVRLRAVRTAMEDYLQRGILKEYRDSMIYIERTDSGGRVRAGIIGAIDLMQYDYHQGSRSPVRASEGTIEGRIPPRLRVRENASLELPHIMLLLDDPAMRVIEKLTDQTGQMEMIYDFPLMMGGGSIRGWLLTRKMQAQVMEALGGLAMESPADDPMVFAVGDGNHSLATAKEYYEQLKAAHPHTDLSDHPARYALAEIVNLHSPALQFEPIHRIVTNVNTDDLFHHMVNKLGLVREDRDQAPHDDRQRLTVVLKGQEESMVITRPSSKLTVGSLQNFLDEYIRDRSETEDIKVDYIHGRDNLKALTWRNGSMGFILPVMAKEDLFPTVKADGALPRKTFSMGHAEDKKYYIECRRIKKGSCL